MSDYTQVSFVTAKDIVPEIRKYMVAKWDAHELSGELSTNWPGLWNCTLTISELDLLECMPILDELREAFGLIIVVEHGVLY
jgi:hypothetical protein